MLELIAMLGVLGVLAAATIPLFTMVFGQGPSRAVAEELVKVLNRARELAITRNTDVCVTLGDNTIVYRMGGCDGTVFVGETDSRGNIPLSNAAPVTSAAPVVFGGLGGANPSGTYVVQTGPGGAGLNVVVPPSGRVQIK